jgi:hypothetical protein
MSLARGVIACAVLAGVMAAPTPACCSGADEPSPDPWQDMISPDRPGAATPPSVMDRGVFQIETCFESQIARPPDASVVKTEDFPTLLRYGLGHDLEVRVESNTVSFAEAVTGFADMSVEAKWLALDRPAGRVPSVAFLPAVSIPSGTSAFSAGKVQAGLSALLGWTLPSGTSLSLDAALSRVVQSSDSSYVWQGAWQTAFQIPLQREWAISGDLFVGNQRRSIRLGAAGERIEHALGLDAGVEYYPNPVTQIDLAVIQTFAEPGTATAVQLGFSRRIGLRARH